ncbi:hypothetical protein [uncultured Sphingomonas sp.]|uniref:hypothetical protein n=1 Tax=uncultured Sphingomonas sp. TaxID=158754 RepID=UPI002607D748|nr:hypothetical protein [uncultured Sphingomonas sp.]
MPLPLLELPVIATALLLHPSETPPSRPMQCASRHPATIADCCVHFRDGEVNVDRASRVPQQLPAQESEGRANHAAL